MIHTRSDGNGGFHNTTLFSTQFRGTGLTTGTEYTGKTSAKHTFNSPAAFNQTNRNQFTLRPKGKGDTIKVDFLLHFTGNANGILTVDFTTLTVTCK